MAHIRTLGKNKDLFDAAGDDVLDNDDNDDEGDEEDDEDEKEIKASSLTPHERRTNRLSSQISELESALLAPKSWELRG